MPCCALRYCHSYYGHKSSRNFNLFSFPAPNDVTRDKWIKFVQLERKEDDWLPSTISRLCSKHFDPEDVHFGKTGRGVLRKGAVPVYTTVKENSKDIVFESNLSSMDDENDSVHPIEEGSDTEEVKEEPHDEDEFTVIIQDPISQTTLEGSFRELHSRRPGEDSNLKNVKTPPTTRMQSALNNEENYRLQLIKCRKKLQQKTEQVYILKKKVETLQRKTKDENLNDKDREISSLKKRNKILEAMVDDLRDRLKEEEGEDCDLSE